MMLIYDDSKDLYEGLITETGDNIPQTQIAMVFPAGREYGYKLAAALDMYEALQLYISHQEGKKGHYCSICHNAIGKALLQAKEGEKHD